MKQYFKVLRHYADFSGRASRKEYWMFVLFNFIFAVGVAILNSLFNLSYLRVVWLFYLISIAVPGMAVTVRRLHDTGRKGWWLLIVLIPLILHIFTYDDRVGGSASLFVTIGCIWLIVYMALAGDPDTNRYGVHPKRITGYATKSKIKSAAVAMIIASAAWIFAFVGSRIKIFIEYDQFHFNFLDGMDLLAGVTMLVAAILLSSLKKQKTISGTGMKTTSIVMIVASALFLVPIFGYGINNLHFPFIITNLIQLADAVALLFFAITLYFKTELRKKVALILLSVSVCSVLARIYLGVIFWSDSIYLLYILFYVSLIVLAYAFLSDEEVETVGDEYFAEDISKSTSVAVNTIYQRASLKGLKCPDCGNEALTFKGEEGATTSSVSAAFLGVVGQIAAGKRAVKNMEINPVRYKCNKCKHTFSSMPLQASSAEILTSPCTIHCKRISNIFGAIVPQFVFLNGIKIGAVKNGKTISFQTCVKTNTLFVTDHHGTPFKLAYTFVAEQGATVVVQYSRSKISGKTITPEPNKPAENLLPPLSEKEKITDEHVEEKQDVIPEPEPAKSSGGGLGSIIFGLLITILLIVGGLSGEFVLRGTESSTALVVVGFLYLMWDIYAIIAYINRKIERKNRQAKYEAEQEANETLEPEPTELEKLLKIRINTPANDIIAMFGSPDSTTTAAEIFTPLMGRVPASEQGKVYWVYHTPYGDLQIVIKDNQVSETNNLENIIEKLKAELPTEEKSEEEIERILNTPTGFSIAGFEPLITVPGFTKYEAYRIIEDYLVKNKPENMDADETELLKPFFINLLMFFRNEAQKYIAQNKSFGGACDSCSRNISVNDFYLFGSYAKCSNCALRSIVCLLDWNYYLTHVVTGIGNVSPEIVSQAYEIKEAITARREAKNAEQESVEQPQAEKGFTLDNLLKIQVNTPVNEIVEMFGTPDSQQTAAEIFIPLLGHVPDSGEGNEYCRYRTPYGDLQMVIKDNLIIDTGTLKNIIGQINAKPEPEVSEQEISEPEVSEQESTEPEVSEQESPEPEFSEPEEQEEQIEQILAEPDNYPAKENNEGNIFIQYFKVLKHYADFSGRASRKEYWMFILFNIIFLFAATMADGFFKSILLINGTFAGGAIIYLYIVALIIPVTAVTVRRLHDVGKSAWWLLSVVTVTGFILIPSQSGDNRYGIHPKQRSGYGKAEKIKSTAITLIIASACCIVAQSLQQILLFTKYDVYGWDFLEGLFLLTNMMLLVAGVLLLSVRKGKSASIILIIASAIWLTAALWADINNIADIVYFPLVLVPVALLFFACAIYFKTAFRKTAGLILLIVAVYAALTRIYHEIQIFCFAQDMDKIEFLSSVMYILLPVSLIVLTSAFLPDGKRIRN